MMPPKHLLERPRELIASGLHELTGGVAQSLSGEQKIVRPNSIGASEGRAASALHKLWCTPRAQPPPKMGLFRFQDWD
ncbi:hypothetical protein ACVMB1_006035 [Bradyrhizobium sp. USDA 4504]